MTLRKITVEDTVYLYKCVVGFAINTEIATFEITIFLNGYKQTPLKISFITWEDLYAGNPLKTGVKLTKLSTKQEELVNFNKPKYIRECILDGLKTGWKGKNKAAFIDGLEFLKALGYDVVFYIPKRDLLWHIEKNI
ncbi:hypothetical protein [Flavobacterium sp.]|uniref:hypothetical protein n=1 Tax=Flavobacterium sp. TaxID=239 RepID=UPI003D09C5B7